MLTWFGRRYLDLLGCIYIYNEHRGYTAHRLGARGGSCAVPDDLELIAASSSTGPTSANIM